MDQHGGATGSWRDFLSSLRRITSSNRRYIPEVDGLRFLAIGSVLLFHVLYAATHALGIDLHSPDFHSALMPFRHGDRGVELFFVISGFILGLPFAAHHLAGARRVKKGRYFRRRLTRLEPPYILALVGFYLVATAFNNADAASPGFWPSLWQRLLYSYSLIHGEPSSLNGVTWTLEVEVQFYLLAPLLASVFRLPIVPRRTFLIASVVLWPLVAALSPFFILSVIGYAQYFLLGFLLADLHVSNDVRVPGRTADALGFAGLVACASLPISTATTQFLPWLMGLIWLGAMKGRWFSAAMRVPIVTVVGGMCYSLYLLHYPLISFLTDHVVDPRTSLVMAFLSLGVVALPIALLAGTIFYMLVERPCMNPEWPARLARNLWKPRRAPDPSHGLA